MCSPLTPEQDNPSWPWRNNCEMYCVLWNLGHTKWCYSEFVSSLVSFLIKAINFQRDIMLVLPDSNFGKKKQQRKVISDRFCSSVILTVISKLFRGWLLVQQSIVPKETWPFGQKALPWPLTGFSTVLSGWEAPFPSASSPEVSSSPLTPQGPFFL